MAVTMKNAVLCGSCENRRRLLVTAKVVPSSRILVTLMMEALRSSETSVLTRATWRNNTEDGIIFRGHIVSKSEPVLLPMRNPHRRTEPSIFPEVVFCRISEFWTYEGLA
jgi:hypothetical protein